MPRFFIPCGDAAGEAAFIRGEDAKHIALSLRMAVGERLTVCDFSRREYECRLSSVTPALVTAEILSSKLCSAEPECRIVLYQAVPKSDKLDIIVQKAVECGASEIIPFLSERCVSRPDAAAAAKKRERLQRISKEAAMQCGRGIIPAIGAQTTLGELLSREGEALKLFFYEGDGTEPLPRLLEGSGGVPSEIRIIIGSEGGFSLAECEKARSAGYIAAGLGKRILRCETAAAFALACLSYRFEMNAPDKITETRVME